jgi:hypothetical protein
VVVRNAGQSEKLRERKIVRFVRKPGEKCGLKVHFLFLSVVLIDTWGWEA